MTGTTITSAPQGASIPAEGIKPITWSFVKYLFSFESSNNSTDPSQMDIRCTFPDLPFNGTLIASAGDPLSNLTLIPSHRYPRYSHFLAASSRRVHLPLHSLLFLPLP